VRNAVTTGMKAYTKLFVRPMVDEDVTRLLDLRIRRISAYDIEKNRKEIEEIDKKIAEIDRKLKNMVKTTIQYLEGMLKKYGPRYPRKTRITEIQAVDKKAVARQNLKLSYDKETSYFGSEVRGELFKLNVSEFENVLAIAKDGTYRIMTAPEKVLFTAPMVYAEVFDEAKGVEFTVVYRDKSRTAYAKRIRIEKFIRNREYQLIKDKGGKIDLPLPEGETGTVEMEFVPAKRQRLKEMKFDLRTLELTSPTARGARMAPKPVAKVRLIPGPAGKSGGSRKAASGDADSPSATARPSKPSSPGGAGQGGRGTRSGSDSGSSSGPKQGDLF
jgi:topoisomerase IV subunit A